ncbi:hypothetical protein BJ508DRAFT_335466 [Ascobolus immersus RN42]|uniref:Uncharacterized protein n=1 Tax=Ascobolus immersus RN42 TaxID=1160509 RepID=A0A3N4HFT6_ASCIM|nr:hypothetical protein BJ508DRAFT_335466 [Ascobolus immersus RN42]
MHDTLYAAFLIPLTHFGVKVSNTTNSTQLFPTAPQPFPSLNWLPFSSKGPLYGFLRGDPADLTDSQMITDKISLLDCPDNHASGARDDYMALIELDAALEYGRNGPRSWWTTKEWSAVAVRPVTHVKERFWECLDSNKKGVGFRLQECLCMELRDIDASKAFRYPQLNPRAYDHDEPSDEFEEYWAVMNEVICWSQLGFEFAQRRQPSACKDLDKYDEYDKFRGKFLGERKDSASGLYREWRDQYLLADWRRSWDSYSRVRAYFKNPEAGDI